MFSQKVTDKNLKLAVNFLKTIWFLIVSSPRSNPLYKLLHHRKRTREFSNKTRQNEKSFWFHVENIYIFQLTNIFLGGKIVGLPTTTLWFHHFITNTFTTSPFSLLHVIFFTPQKFTLLHKQFWFEHPRVDNNTKNRLRIFFLRSMTFCAKTNSSFIARAQKRSWMLFSTINCLLYLIQTPYQAFWDCSV